VNHLEATKTVVGDAVTASALTATLTVDTLGYDYASIDVIVAKSGTAGHTANSVLSALSIAQGNVSNSVTGTVYTVAVPPASVAVTAQPSVVRLDVDCRGKGRYLKVDASPAVDLTTMVVARLGRGEKGADTAAEKGALAKYSG
jgi:hypothetical protein